MAITEADWLPLSENGSYWVAEADTYAEARDWQHKRLQEAIAAGRGIRATGIGRSDPELGQKPRWSAYVRVFATGAPG